MKLSLKDLSKNIEIDWLTIDYDEPPKTVYVDTAEFAILGLDLANKPDFVVVNGGIRND
jgi:hypothetical protein